MTRLRSVAATLAALAPVLCVLLLTPVTHAQSPEATISGIVTDGTGAALPGVTITALQMGTGQRVVAVSNHEGFYALRPCPSASTSSRRSCRASGNTGANG